MRIALVVVCLLAAFLIACGGDDGNGSAETEVNAAELLQRSAAAVQNVSSFHFELTQEDAVIPLPLNLNLDSAEGDVVMPDRLKATLRTRAQGVNVSVAVIAIGGETWVTNPFTRSWQRQSVDLRDFADLAELLPAVLPAIRNPRVTGQEDIDGVRAYRVEGTAATADLQQALPFSLPNREVSVVTWIGVEDSLPRRVRVTGPLIAGEPDDAARQVDLSRFDRPVNIVAP